MYIGLIPVIKKLTKMFKR